MSLLWHYRELVWAAIAWAAYATVIVLVALAFRRPKREPEEGLDPGSLPDVFALDPMSRGDRDVVGGGHAIAAHFLQGPAGRREGGVKLLPTRRQPHDGGWQAGSHDPTPAGPTLPADDHGAGGDGVEPWPIEWDAYGHARPVDPEQAETLAHLRRAMPRKFEPKLKEEA